MNWHIAMIGFTTTLSLYAVIISSQNRWLLSRILEREVNASRASIEIITKLIEIDSIHNEDSLWRSMSDEEKNKVLSEITSGMPINPTPKYKVNI